MVLADVTYLKTMMVLTTYTIALKKLLLEDLV